MKKYIITFALLIGCMIAADMNTYCSAPPFVGGKNAIVIPNVLITHDMTGSMRFLAYRYFGEPYNPAFTYYGYADPHADYGRVYTAGHYYFQKKPAGTGTYAGNYINYYFMTRMDVSRKAFTGGKGVAYNNKSRLIFEYPRSYSGYSYYGIVTTDTIEVKPGIIRRIADTDSDYVWDDGAPYFALQVFSTSWDFYRQIRCPFGMPLDTFLMVFEDNRPGQNNSPNGGTNCGDAIFEAVHYLRYCQPHWGGDYAWNSNWVGMPSDPWYEVVGGDTVSVSCRPTFCIVVGDGGSNSDNPVSNCAHLPHPASPYGAGYWNFYQYDGDNDSYDPCNWGVHDRCGDDYAYYAHVTDLRPDADPVYGIPDEQTVMFYSVYLFAQGDDSDADSIFFRKIAMHGGFIDVPSDTPGSPGYKKYDKQVEYDTDLDGRPDHFFYVNDGQQLENALTDIFINIQELSRVTSATAGSVTGSGTKGAGLVYNAQFYPKLDLSSTLALSWLGRIFALWIDPYGNLREETQGNYQLHLTDDYVVQMYFDPDPAYNTTRAIRLQDTSGLGTLVPIDTVAVEDLHFVWNGSRWLLETDPNDREIYCCQPSGVRQPFVIGQDWLDPHFDFGGANACDTLIEYIRGQDFTGYRSREWNHPDSIWKLGDIIHSSPMPVGEPSEGYHLIYGDNEYGDFWDHYFERRTVLYSGGNDGMIHAFNAGLYTEIDDPITIAELDPLGEQLGEELWGFVPHNVLPHLKWLMDTSYCHVYFNDLKPYPTDMQIFPSDPPNGWHPWGWGTILICGMRFGGGEYTIPGGDTYRSSYTCFDVTDPDHDNHRPLRLWEFTDDNLGFTMCIPGVIKIEDPMGTDTWYLLFGSGPQSMYGECTQNARIYVVNPATGALVDTFIVPDPNSAITNVFTADYGLTYSTNLAYFGTYDNNGGGKIYRLMTHNDPNTANWNLYEVMNVGRPITAEGSIATDDRGNLWIYFGTGKYYSNVDVGDTTIQCFLGIKDDTTNATTPFNFGDLVDVTNVSVFADSVTGIAGVSNFEDLVAHIETYAGWYRWFDSIPGERVITTPLILGGALIFTSFIPQDTTGTAQGPDLCIGGGGGPQAGHLWAVFYTTGTAYKTAMLDTTATGEHKTHVSIIGDVPSEPAMHIGSDQEKVFVQSAGGLIGVETPLPYNPRGGVMLWRGR
jgi:type IV pilus assembly protein PilY1